MRGIVIGLSVALLAGCGGADKGAGSTGNAAENGSAARAESNAAAPASALDETQRRVVAMGDAERNAVLIRAIRGAHLDCQHVDSSESTGNPGGQPTYVATCDRTKRYAVTIGPNGAGAVTSAQEQGR